MQDSKDIPTNGEEIDLREIFSTLWKRKWLIAGITFACLLAAILYSLNLPKINRIFMVIEPSIIGVTPDGNYLYLDSSDNIKGKIESSAYQMRILNALHLNPSELGFALKTTVPKGANIIVVSSEFPAEKARFEVKVFQQLLTEMRLDYAGVIRRKKDEYHKQILIKQNQINDIEIKRKDLDKQISIKQSHIKGKKDQINVLNSSLAIYEQREKDLLDDLKEVRVNTQRLVRQRDDVMLHGSSDDEKGMSDLLYSTTIQQNISFFNELKKQINEMKIDKENLRSNIKTWEKDINEIGFEIERLKLQQSEELLSQINAIKIEIEDLKGKIDLIQNIKTISGPTVSRRPIKPRIMFNISISLMAGLFFGIFVALLAEYLSAEKRV